MSEKVSLLFERLRSRWEPTESDDGDDTALFLGLASNEVREILDAGTVLRAQPGETIVKEGDAGKDLFLILSGAVAVRRYVNDEPRDLVELQAGEIFGEVAFLGGFPRTADIVAVSPSEIFSLSREAYLRVSDAAPAAAFGILLNISLALCQRLATTTDVQTDVLTRSERMKTQQEIDRRRTLSQMVAGVAHEINTPLGIANHAASIVTELAGDLAKARPESARVTLDDIMAACRLLQDNVARADRLVQTFKTLSVSQAADRLDKTRLLQLTRDTADLYRLKARFSGLAISVIDRLEGADDEWLGYPGHYAQVLLNLLTNVDRYAYPEDTGGKVEIDAAVRGQCFVVTVRDFGRGIAKADFEHIFEPFFTTGRGRGGTGLGLSIVKNLVEESLNGRISARSEPGAGVEMEIEMPHAVVPKSDA
ncbi:MAG: sensor histidine kinase [Chloroflexota bacterium]